MLVTTGKREGERRGGGRKERTGEGRWKAR
jgi:hypothetical protein